MKARPRVAYLLWGALLAATPLRGASSDTDLDWIARLPGVSVFSQKTTPSYSKTVYTVTGSPDATFEKVRQGLSERGWAIQRSSGSAIAGISASSLVAEKGGARVKITLGQLGGLNTLAVDLTPGEGSARAPSSEPRASTRSQPPPDPGTRAEARPSDERPRKVYDCGDGRVSINVSSSDVTVRGDCGYVIVNGSSNDVIVESRSSYVVVNGASNKVRVDNRVSYITANGDDNTITWSAARNPGGPRVNNNGRNNTVSRH